ncbi:MAG: DUF4349 domain-containing protein [Oscillospiraceae bacterium]|nr:DUF4349 domain-containing protein [Oscillospiraceae bacterium]
MKKFLKITAVIMICVIGLAGCVSYNKDVTEGTMGQVGGVNPPANHAVDGHYDYEMGDIYYEGDEVHGQQISSMPHERKVIRNATLTVESPKDIDVSDLYKQIITYCETLGGYEFSKEMNQFEKFSTVNAVLKIPPSSLNPLLDYIDQNSNITHKRVDSDDVTSEYYDLNTRLETKRRSLDSYYTLLEKADSTSEIVSLQRTIDSIIEDIESVESRLKVLNSLVDMATVNLFIKPEREEPVAERREIDWNALSADDMGYFIKTGFITVVNTIASFFQWLAIALIVSSPVLLPITIVIIIKVRKYRKARKTQEKPIAVIVENPETPEEKGN